MLEIYLFTLAKKQLKMCVQIDGEIMSEFGLITETRYKTKKTSYMFMYDQGAIYNNGSPVA